MGRERMSHLGPFDGIKLNGLGIVPQGRLFFFRWFDQRSDDSETDTEGIRMVPDALGELGIFFFPLGTGGHADAAPQLLRVILPAATANNTWKKYGGNLERVLN